MFEMQSLMMSEEPMDISFFVCSGSFLFLFRSNVLSLFYFPFYYALLSFYSQSQALLVVSFFVCREGRRHQRENMRRCTNEGLNKVAAGWMNEDGCYGRS